MIPYFDAISQINSGYGEIKYAQKLVRSAYDFVKISSIDKNQML